MNLTFLFVAIGVLIFSGVLLALYALVRSWHLRRRARVAEPDKAGLFDANRYKHGLEQIVRPLGEMVPRSPEQMSRQERRLVQAGYRRKDAAYLFLGAQATLAIFFVLLAGATGVLYRHFLLSLVVSVFLAPRCPICG